MLGEERECVGTAMPSTLGQTVGPRPENPPTADRLSTLELEDQEQNRRIAILEKNQEKLSRAIQYLASDLGIDIVKHV